VDQVSWLCGLIVSRRHLRNGKPQAGHLWVAACDDGQVGLTETVRHPSQPDEG
jgi:hypothetical protein